MISKACVVGMYQLKLEELARLPAMDLAVVVPPYWRDGRNVLPLERAHTSGYELRMVPMVLNGSFHLHFYRGLGRLMSEFKPEVVHIDEEPYNLVTWQAMHLARRNHALALFFTWQNLHRRYPFPFSTVERYNLDHAHYAIAGSCDAEVVLRAKRYAGPIKVLPQFGVDPGLFSPRDGRRSASGEFTIGYMGRLVEEKGVQILLQAVAGLTGNWKLRVIGSGPYAETLQSLSVELHVDKQVDFSDHVPSKLVPSELRGLDVLVLPSLTRRNWKEQFGRVLIEAMASEVAVVGSSSGEIPNLVGNAGLVFAEGDAAALREALRALMENPLLRLRLGREGRERVLGCYTQAHVAAETYSVYQQMLSRAQPCG
jgi:glycosyltransferase involved in cell wall biosynthesis